jgi:hypothetical protein
MALRQSEPIEFQVINRDLEAAFNIPQGEVLRAVPRPSYNFGDLVCVRIAQKKARIPPDGQYYVAEYLPQPDGYILFRLARWLVSLLPGEFHIIGRIDRG